MGRDPWITAASAERVRAVPVWDDEGVDPVFFTANHYRYARAEVIGPSFHPHAMLLWVTTGAGVVTVGSEAAALRAGTAMIVPWRNMVTLAADRRHPFAVGAVSLTSTRASGEVYSVASRPALELRAPAAGDPPLAGFERRRVLTGAAAGRLARLAETALAYASIREFDPAMLLSYGRVVARMVQIELEGRPDRVSRPRALRIAQEYALVHLARTLATDELAEVAGCSASALERQFRRFEGTSPQTWLREMRLEAAARELRTTSRGVAEIARSVGFADPFHFSKAFRARFGCAPSGYAISAG